MGRDDVESSAVDGDAVTPQLTDDAHSTKSSSSSSAAAAAVPTVDTHHPHQLDSTTPHSLSAPTLPVHG